MYQPLAPFDSTSTLFARHTIVLASAQVPLSASWRLDLTGKLSAVGWDGITATCSCDLDDRPALPCASVQGGAAELAHPDAAHRVPDTLGKWDSACTRGIHSGSSAWALPTPRQLANTRYHVHHQCRITSTLPGECASWQRHGGGAAVIGSTLNGRGLCRQLHGGSSWGSSSQGNDDGIAGSENPARWLHDAPEATGASAGAAGGTAAAPSSWLDRYCPPRLLPFAHLIRLDKPIGTCLSPLHSQPDHAGLLGARFSGQGQAGSSPRSGLGPTSGVRPLDAPVLPKFLRSLPIKSDVRTPRRPRILHTRQAS
jgi:hypothetical protein